MTSINLHPDLSDAAALERPSTPERIARFIVEQVQAGVLRPGDQLPAESEFAKQLSVSPATLRIALSSLRELGLIRTKRGRYGGSFITDRFKQFDRGLNTCIALGDADGLRDLTDWRRAVSGEAAWLAAQRIDKPMEQQLRELNTLYKLYDADLEKRRSYDAQLHILIAKASGSSRLMRAEHDIQQELTGLITTLPDLNTIRGSVHDGHDSLVKAISARASSRARDEMLHHIESTYNWCVSLLATSDN